MTRRATCGFCVVFHSVRLSEPASYSPIAARGSIAFGARRLLTKSSLVTCFAVFNAASTRLRIAEMPLIDRVTRRDLVNLRRALRRGRIGHRRQDLVVDLDLLGGVLGLRQRLGDDHRDGIADMVCLALRDRRMRRHLHLRAVLGRDHPAANEIADLVRGNLGAGEHREHAGHGGGGAASIALILAWAWGERRK